MMTLRAIPAIAYRVLVIVAILVGALPSIGNATTLYDTYVVDGLHCVSASNCPSPMLPDGAAGTYSARDVMFSFSGGGGTAGYAVDEGVFKTLYGPNTIGLYAPAQVTDRLGDDVLVLYSDAGIHSGSPFLNTGGYIASLDTEELIFLPVLDPFSLATLRLLVGATCQSGIRGFGGPTFNERGDVVGQFEYGALVDFCTDGQFHYVSFPFLWKPDEEQLFVTGLPGFLPVSSAYVSIPSTLALTLVSLVVLTPANVMRGGRLARCPRHRPSTNI